MKRQSNVRVGAAENLLDAPLFAELGGYGPFFGRRNLGVRDPLFCRVLTVSDGLQRNVIIVADTIASDERACRILRMELATDFAILPEAILFIATHTHAAPSLASCDIGYGEPSPVFLENWRRTVRKSVAEAINNEEEVQAKAGRAPIRQPLGQRRTTDMDRHCDPDIRFIKFTRRDGSVKLLLHNHAMHGVAFGRQRYVSGDWMGDANARIKSRQLAEIPLFVYGTAGDINVIWRDEEGNPREPGVTSTPAAAERTLAWIGEHYVDDLCAGLENGTKICLGPISSTLRAIELPTEPVVAAEYRATAVKLLEKLPSPFETLLRYTHDRMLEMAVLAERGHPFRIIRDLQVLKMGDWTLHAIPGEAFLAMGESLRAESPAKFPLPVSVANGDAGYFPTPAMFKQYPSIFGCDDFGAFGFYEVWFGAGLHRPKFKPGIDAFIVEKLLQMENELPG